MPVENLTSQTSLPSINTNYDIERKIKNEEQSQLPLEQPSKEQLEKAVKGINNFIEFSSTHIEFKLHEKLNEYYVTVVDNATKEVVREIPSKKVLDVYAAMTEFIGLIVDKKI
ncbi:flagellar protein FlaG [Metabacillus niabensis]|uniref:flagellar protein FlaG n=1 Tax=Metabacillus niabensis TaxID=324854 RepID=UPI001CFAEF08|nr:flagellar protein FlaG [Metabacillus niabensis]